MWLLLAGPEVHERRREARRRYEERHRLARKVANHYGVNMRAARELVGYGIDW